MDRILPTARPSRLHLSTTLRGRRRVSRKTAALGGDLKFNTGNGRATFGEEEIARGNK